MQAGLDAFTPTEIGLDPEVLDRLRQAAREAADALAAVTRDLAQQGAQVNYKALYDALQGLEPEGLDHCPACATPLTGQGAVHENPFERARIGLGQVRNLAALQERHRAAAENASTTWREFTEYLCRIVALRALEASPAIDMLASLLAEPPENFLEALDAKQSSNAGAGPSPSPWEDARGEALRAKTADAATKTMQANRATDIAERDRLRTAQTALIEIDVLDRQLTESSASAYTRIAGFDTANAQLIAAAETEAEKIALHSRIHSAYNAFLASVQRYRDNLPRALTADLSASTMALYNAFNRYDIDGDKLTRLVLPAADDERIMIAFNSHPGELQDALHVMSEGYLRCLGLAILVAKNIQLRCPVLIFDDPVNAIDDEHRGSIRDTLFEDDLLAGKQIILLCHGEELIKDVEMFIGASRAATDCHSYTLLPHEGDRVIRVDHGGSRNYIVKAREAFGRGRMRDALGESRLATEALCMRTWRFLGKFGQEELRLKLRRNRQPVDSNDLAAQLKRQLAAATFHHPSKMELVECFERMLQRWGMLNPASHEEDARTDFQRQEARALIENLEALDRLLSARTQTPDQAAAVAAAAAIAVAAAAQHAPGSEMARPASTG